jgi:hypothetical protein
VGRESSTLSHDYGEAEQTHYLPFSVKIKNYNKIMLLFGLCNNVIAFPADSWRDGIICFRGGTR